MSGARAVARCDALGASPYSASADGLFRAYLTPEHAETVKAIGAWMVEAGMIVRLDQAANLIGRYEGVEPSAPALMFGSHIDSVRDAGRYDGPLGVMLAIEMVAALNVEGRRLPFAIEVIAFGDEEGSRFPASMLCSRAVAGRLELDALRVGDSDGVSLGNALRGFNAVGDDEAYGISPFPDPLGLATFHKAARKPSEVLAFVEAHIEQGPVLEAEGLALGTVTGIAAQLRFQVVVEGVAGHAGTSSMSLRRDALAAAAEMILAVESQARSAGGDIVATVGRMQVLPGAVNVVPGRVEFSIDIRSGEPERRNRVAEAIMVRLTAIATARDVTIATDQVQDLPASPCDPRLMTLMDQALADCGQPPKRLVSGAGHDTMVMASLCPTAMLFIRCKGGISHNPAESVTEDDAEVALTVLRAFVDRFEEDFIG